MTGDKYKLQRDGRIWLVMEKPDSQVYDYKEHGGYYKYVKAYNSRPNHEVSKELNWETGRVVEECMCFIFQYQFTTDKTTEWYNCNLQVYEGTKEEQRRLIAVPLPTPSSPVDVPSCSQHKKDLFGQTDMKVVAEAIGDLHYETMCELFDYLANKFARDAINDAKGGRYSLATELNCASHNIHEAFENIENAWELSKPFMDNQTIKNKG